MRTNQKKCVWSIQKGDTPSPVGYRCKIMYVCGKEFTSTYSFALVYFGLTPGYADGALLTQCTKSSFKNQTKNEKLALKFCSSITHSK